MCYMIHGWVRKKELTHFVGAYGEVYTARWRGRVVAVKRFPLNVPEHRRYVLKTFQRSANASPSLC